MVGLFEDGDKFILGNFLIGRLIISCIVFTIQILEERW